MPDTPQFDADIRAALESSYALERELLGGGMSRVFLATERSLNRRVVIKVLPPELAAGVNRERFRREIQLAAQLQHPHIVPLYAAGEHGELLYYTMPFIEGESLRHALLSDKPVRFSIREVVHILHDVVDALAYAHARGVIHRDIKPGNVLRSGSHAVVTDFGVAKAISVSLPLSGVTTTGMAVGTPAYMAPEQLAGDPAADHRMDIYAVGLLGYELLTGVAPFSSPSPQQTLAAQLTRDPAPIDKVRNDVPPGMSALIMRCLAKMPEKRPQTAADLLAELDGIAPQSGDFAAARRAGSQRIVGIAVAAGLLLAATYAWSRRAPADPAVLTGRDTTAAAPVAPAPPPAARVAAQVPLLSRAESLAIATAVDRKMKQSAAAPAVASPVPGMTAAQILQMTDSLRASIQTAVLDSFARLQRSTQATFGTSIDRNGNTRTNVQPDARFMPPGLDDPGRVGRDLMQRFQPLQASDKEAFMQRAANPGPPRRVFVSVPPRTRSRPDVDVAAQAMMDTLRHRLAQSKRFLPVEHDSVVLALSQSRVSDSLAKLLKVELFASLYPIIGRDSSVTWQLTVRDLTAHPKYSLRNVIAKVPHDSLLAPLDSLVRGAARALDEMDRAPRRVVKP
ncbi:MAG: serine/threonine-protein kinase [bacterium]